MSHSEVVHSKPQAEAASAEAKLDTDRSELGPKEVHDILEYKGSYVHSYVCICMHMS